MTDKTAFEQWWHEKCETDFAFPNESSFISHIAKQAWNVAIDAALAKCKDIYGFEEVADEWQEIQKLRSE